MQVVLFFNVLFHCITYYGFVDQDTLPGRISLSSNVAIHFAPVPNMVMLQMYTLSMDNTYSYYSIAGSIQTSIFAEVA